MARLLIVEDYQPAVAMWSKLLKVRGHQVFSAENGIDGLSALSNNPHIIFCDYNMPRMDGYQFCRAVKTNPEYRLYANIPIVGIGSFPQVTREHLARLLSKPISNDDFFQCIEDFACF